MPNYPERPAVSAELHDELRGVLMACDQFSSHANLQAVFVTAELSPWRKALPEASSHDGRVDVTIAYLSDKSHASGDAALTLFLRQLATRYDPGDSRHGLLEIERKVTAALRPSKQGRRPTAGVLHNLPARNNNFTGRDRLLADIEKALAGGNAVALTQAVFDVAAVQRPTNTPLLVERA